MRAGPKTRDRVERGLILRRWRVRIDIADYLSIERQLGDARPRVAVTNPRDRTSGELERRVRAEIHVHEMTTGAETRIVVSVPSPIPRRDVSDGRTRLLVARHREGRALAS